MGVSFNRQGSEKLALEIVIFLKNWGLWKDVQILTNGKCYRDKENGELEIYEEIHPEGYTMGICKSECLGKCEWKDYSNPERLLDMTFEGPLSLLLRHGEYEVSVEDLSDTAKQYIFGDKNAEAMEDILVDYVDEYIQKDFQWMDPDEFDSFDQWMEISDYCEGEFNVTPEDIMYHCKSTDANEISDLDFASREEYEDFIGKIYSVKEEKIRDYFEEEAADEIYYSETFYDNGSIADYIVNEFNALLEKYGLWYELGFSWSLTTYRI